MTRLELRRVHEWQASFDALLETLQSAGEDASVEILLNAPTGAFTGTEAMARTCEKLEELRDTAVAEKLGLQALITKLLRRWREMTAATD